MRTAALPAVAILSVLVSACSADGVGSCTSSSECAAGQVCTDGRCVPRSDVDGGGGLDGGRRDGSATADAGDASCGGEGVPIDYRPPNVLVVFDRSCSMRRQLDGVAFGTGPDDPTTRWNVAREAIVSLVRGYEARVFWGLMAFPDPREGCGMPVDAEVLPGPMNAAAIEAELLRDQIQPFGLCGPDNTDTTTQPRDTPTVNALTSAMALPALSDPMRPSFALLVTDGGVSCGVSTAELTTLAASFDAAGIPLAVVGFATGAMEATLEALAASGGLPNPAGPPSYFVAESRADLDAIFDSIAERVVSCDLTLTSTPPDGAALYVYANDMEVVEDPANGWTYDRASNTVSLNGETCSRLRRGDIRRISVSVGCAPVMCIPADEVCNGLDDDCDDAIDEDCLL